MTTFVLLAVLLFASAAKAARPLEARAERQRATLHADRGALRFCHRHPLARKFCTRAHLRFFRAEIRWTTRELAETMAALLASLDPRAAIGAVFGGYAGQALAVADCETGGTFSLAAVNGQYLGLFQMGDWERATYAHGRYGTALDQSRAAWRYFVARGHSWDRWSCQP